MARFPSLFEDFFGDDFFGGFSIPQLRQKGTELREVGGGSGFLVSTDGYIVTNRHIDGIKLKPEQSLASSSVQRKLETQ